MPTNYRRSLYRHARTLDEAFPFGAEYGSAIEKPRRFSLDQLILPTCLVCAALLTLALLAWR